MSTSAPDLVPEATATLARFAAQLRFEQIPPQVREHVKLCVLDGIGVALFGSRLPWTRMVLDMLCEEGARPVATFWGTDRRGSASQAALLNGTAGHAFEMDDIHKESILHPNSLAVPVALALAEEQSQAGRPVTGTELLTAIVAGYELGTRVGNAATMALFLRGFHPQGTSGAFVAAACAGRLLQLSPEQMQHALGIAGSMGAGLMAAQEGAMVKRLHAGRAAQAGIYAARLAQRGFSGISNVIEAGYGGFLSSLSGSPNAARLLDGLGERWEAGEVGFKLYPSVTSIHSALDALSEIMAAHGLSGEDIAQIHVGCGHMTYVHTAWPYKPAGITAAQMNLYYGLAVLALNGDASAAQYTDDNLADPRLLQFMSRISAAEDVELEAMGPAYRHACRLQVRTAKGAVISVEKLSRRGSPEAPVSAAEIEKKFSANAGAVLGMERALWLQDQVRQLEACPDAGELAAGLRHVNQASDNNLT